MFVKFHFFIYLFVFLGWIFCGKKKSWENTKYLWWDTKIYRFVFGNANVEFQFFKITPLWAHKNKTKNKAHIYLYTFIYFIYFVLMRQQYSWIADSEQHISRCKRILLQIFFLKKEKDRTFWRKTFVYHFLHFILRGVGEAQKEKKEQEKQSLLNKAQYSASLLFVVKI